MAPLRFSLVLSTIGRRDDLMRFCASLDEQTYRHFELILVDQSESNQLVDVVRRFDSRFPIAHLRSARGLSRGRNAGIEASTGQLICFPDDDSWYGRDLLERVAAKFEVRPVLDLVSGTVVDEAGAAVGRWDRRGGQITRWNVWHRAVSMSIFVRRHVIDEVGGFDEMIGVGSSSPFLSGEETDFVTRIIDKGFDCHYDPSLVAFHPSKKYSLAGIERAFGYGAGMGFVLAKQHFSVISAGVLFIRACLAGLGPKS
jgi:GT2 family glycosyltransferase